MRQSLLLSSLVNFKELQRIACGSFNRRGGELGIFLENLFGVEAE
jgi:hypothetical protein